MEQKKKGALKQRLVQIVVKDPSVLLHHGEIVWKDGKPIGDVRGSSFSLFFLFSFSFLLFHFLLYFFLSSLLSSLFLEFGLFIALTLLFSFLFLFSSILSLSLSSLSLLAGSYGHTLGGSVGLAMIRREEDEEPISPSFLERGKWEVEVGGGVFPIVCSLKPFYDPGGLKLKE